MKNSLSRRLFDVQRTIASGALRPSVVEFGEWTPDRAALGSPGARTATNVFPKPDGYGPWLDFSAVSTNALTARCQGAASGEDGTGNTVVFAGDATKLYKLASNAWSDVSGATYTTAADARWEFAQYGAEFIATNYTDAVQGFTVGTDAAFSDLITSTLKPKAKTVCVFRDFVVLGWTNDATDGEKRSRVWWSANGSAIDFDPSASTQCDFQDLDALGDCGAIQQMVACRDFVLIFCSRQIYRMSYIGGGLVFRFDVIDDARGSISGGSVVNVGSAVFFWSQDGIMVTDGVQSQPIGFGKVDKWLLDQFDATYKSRISSAVEPSKKLIVWSFPGTGATAGAPNSVLLYNWALGRFSYVDLDLEIVFRGATSGYTLDGLDAISTDMDALSFSLDSDAWKGRDIFGAFDSDHTFGQFNGSALEATIDTAESQPISDGLSTVQGCRPLVDGGTPTVAVASRITQQGSVSFGTATAINTDGESTFLSTGRYHRFQVVIPAASTWTHAQGVQMRASSAGSN